MADDKIIELREERMKREGPAAHLVYIDGMGRKWFKFLFDFHDREADSDFGFELWALDEADALRRLDLLKGNAKYVGKLYEEIKG